MCCCSDLPDQSAVVLPNVDVLIELVIVPVKRVKVDVWERFGVLAEQIPSA
jgi:hypothetical protein